MKLGHSQRTEFLCGDDSLEGVSGSETHFSKSRLSLADGHMEKNYLQCVVSKGDRKTASVNSEIV
jgi:hypothetical protein